MIDRINELIESKGLKQKFIAEKMGISDVALSTILNGKRKIYADEFLKLCYALEVSPNELFGYSDTKTA